jgi:hypothetical protein
MTNVSCPVFHGRIELTIRTTGRQLFSPQLLGDQCFDAPETRDRGKLMAAMDAINDRFERGAIFTTAGKLLGELASLDSDSALRSRLRHYARPSLLAIDEVGYLSYSSRYADLLFELVSRRHEQKSPLLTTNKSFADWNEVFPNAACVVALVDRLVHHAEIVGIKGQSYRQKEAQEQAKARAGKRKTSKVTK